MPYLAKQPIADKRSKAFEFQDAKTMYGGRKIKVGDTLYVFDSENEGGSGLLARAVVTAVGEGKRIGKPGRITPRVTVTARRTASAKKNFGREELGSFRDWNDERPQTEIAFKFYRQATNKIGGISDAAARFLERYF